MKNEHARDAHPLLRYDPLANAQSRFVVIFLRALGTRKNNKIHNLRTNSIVSLSVTSTCKRDYGSAHDHAKIVILYEELFFAKFTVGPVIDCFFTCLPRSTMTCTSLSHNITNCYRQKRVPFFHVLMFQNKCKRAWMPIHIHPRLTR